MRFIVKKKTEAVKAPKEVYRLHVEVTSGDNAHTAINVEDFTDLVQLQNTIVLLSSVWTRMSHKDSYSDKKVMLLLESVGKDLGFKYPITVYSELVGYDATTDGQFAHLESMRVTFFNRQKIEHDVEIKVGEISCKLLNDFICEKTGNLTQ